ncbi:DUF975 family protein [Paenibacillus glycanilyticus]|uniref:DUF975 family protein n=1 Tax=Paenibacillus glycanilyticus TaxID=126569 RepID=UPI002040E782|nr:DUF975 family protein [Paenibacillus glycanilyticus]MCM3629585.1 DUF975 family protein [Paenibacillus glycanilyticus]
MNATYSELRARARHSLEGNWGKSILALIVYGIVAGLIGLLNFIPVLGYIIQILTGGAFALGLIIFFVGIARKEGPQISEVFSGFSHFIKAFCVYFLMTLFTVLWTLLFIIPGIIAYLRYSQAYYILQDNPDIGALEAIRQSKQLMKGRKWKLFVLNLTFIGWMFLALLTLGIGFLWLYPYILVTQAHFYDEITGRTTPPPHPTSF